MKKIFGLALASLLISLLAKTSFAQKSGQSPKKEYVTENVIILVIDGPRLSETWDSVSRPCIPNRVALMPEATIVKNFRNEGTTNTNPGHAAIMTGYYEQISNSGKDLPKYPSFFQQWLKYTSQPQEKAWIITSKDKLEVLADCRLESWKGTFKPSTDCGKSGKGSGYRSDSVTIANTKKVMKKKKPKLILINVKDVDSYGHARDWHNYIEAIKTTDGYVRELWDYIQSHKPYKNKTTFFVTNDHGRHLTGLLNEKGLPLGSYVDHGDKCSGCVNIELMALGPDFKKGYVLQDKTYGLVDISATAAKLLNLPLAYGNGRVMEELFK